MTDKWQDVDERIRAYIANGGLFNPELANHNAVRDLLLQCREAFRDALAEGERAGMERVGKAVETAYNIDGLSADQKLFAMFAAIRAAKETKE